MTLAVSVASLIRDVYVAPACPEPVAVLFEAAMTLQNTGYFEGAVNMLLDAQKKWEQVLMREQFPSLVQASSMTVLQQLISSEQEVEAERELVLEMELEEKIKRDALGPAPPAVVAAAVVGGGGPSAVAAPAAISKISDKERLESLRRSREAKLAAKAQIHREGQEREQERIKALHVAADRVPLEAKVFVQLSISSVFESAGTDELALAAGLEAFRLARLIPSFHTNLMTSYVYSCLGSVYYHLSQYDLAADYLFKALEIREQVLTAQHVDVAQVLHNIAAVLLMLRKPSDALAHLYRAKEVFERQLPPTHPRVEITSFNIQLAKKLEMGDKPPPHVPFNFGNVIIPVIPGARRAQEMLAGKKKKKKSAEPTKKK